ncbi:MAG: hypothetical protein R8M38_10645 [Mariprofundaceae bacterium]
MISPITVLILAFAGLLISLHFGGIISQPDWALASLLAAALVKRKSWPWVLPGVMLHDLALFWSPLVTLPFFLLLSPVLYHLDERLGEALPQRMLALVVVTTPLLWHQMGVEQFLLTIMLAIPLWHLFANVHQPAP